MLDAAWIWDKAPSAHAPSEEESGTWDEELAENLPTTRYAYDGQMCALEDFTRYLGGSTMSVDKKRYALGARGIEMIESRAYDAPAWSQAFPLYDGHGNMIATLSRVENTTQYQVSNLRSFDAWGGVRSGSSSGGPTQRYCASLGHVQDDESSLIHMRARYYEPTTGRFISEDPARDGVNWFAYSCSRPADCSDRSGYASLLDILNNAYNETKSQLETAAFYTNARASMLGSLMTSFVKYAERYSEALGDDFLEILVSTNGRVWIIGDPRGSYFQIAIDTATGIIKSYGPGGTHDGLPPGIPPYFP